MATLKTIIQGDLIPSVHQKAALFIKALQHPLIQKITHKGLLMAIHLENDAIVKKVIQYCLENGVLTDWFLFAPQCLRIAPPLIISEEEILFACQVIMKALDAVEIR
jgi:acetylornithine/succinyldiaminopimelate/putrescine aminotransferase